MKYLISALVALSCLALPAVASAKGGGGGGGRGASASVSHVSSSSSRPATYTRRTSPTVPPASTPAPRRHVPKTQVSCSTLRSSRYDTDQIVFNRYCR